MKKSRLLGISLLLFISANAGALENTYQFTQIWLRGGNVETFGAPAINNDGFVAFTGQSFSNMFVGNGTQTRLVMDGDFIRFGHVGDLNLNAAGQTAASVDVTFVGFNEAILRGDVSQGVSGQQVLTTASIGSNIDIFGGDAGIDNQGTAYFFGRINSGVDQSTLYSHDGSTLNSLVGIGDTTSVGNISRLRSINNLAVNGNGELAFSASVGANYDHWLFARSGGLLNPIAANGRSFSMNDSGNVAFANGTLTSLSVSDGVVSNTVVPESSGFDYISKSSINNSGSFAFQQGLTTDTSNGIYTGADPTNDRLIGAGDSIELIAPDGTVTTRTVATVRIGNRAINDSGQIAISALLDLGSSGGVETAIIRADAPGSTENNPLLPEIIEPGDGGTPPRFLFPCGLWSMCEGGVVRWFDPDIAVGYDYIAEDGAPNFASVFAPEGIGDNLYDLFLFDADISDYFDSGIDILGGTSYSFIDDLGLTDGLSLFSLRGIETDALLDPNDPTAFVTGLSFVEASDLGQIVMSPVITTVVPIPPAVWLFGSGLLGLVSVARRKKA